jgi:DNA-binding LytR/AlgR family response regulator
MGIGVKKCEKGLQNPHLCFQPLFFPFHRQFHPSVKKGSIYNIENTLEELEEKLDPSVFFRANRQFIVAREAIHEIEFYFNGRLSIKIQPLAAEKILVSKERVPVFRKWFEVV